MTNDDLFIDVLAHIERNPASWNQSTWGNSRSCGTVACFAGWACALSGVNILELSGYMIAERAVGLLGLGVSYGAEAADIRLFGGLNSMGDLYRISAEHMNIDETVLRDKVQDRLAS